VTSRWRLDGASRRAASPAALARSWRRRAGRHWEALGLRVRRAGSWFFRGRYQLLAALFGLQPEGDAGTPRGTLFIEIDGLGYGHLQVALERGYLPFVRRLLERGEYRAYRWRCGLAADTPPIQSALMYGTNEGVVGFYWWDRRQQKRIVGANPYHMRTVQAQLAARAGQPGLLAGGSSYSNIMSGDARYAVLTIAGANPHWFQPGQGLLRALLVLALNPGKAIRFCFDAAWELLQEMEDRLIVTVLDRPRVWEGAFPLVRILLNVLAREIVTAGTRVDLLRGVPVIYTCYIGYDIVGHHSGPLSRNALRVLRGIDGAIRKLFDTLAWAERPYEVVILSDHGMSACQPVAEAFDHDFESWVEAWWRQGVQALPRALATRRPRRRRPRRTPQGGPWLARLAGSVARRSSGWLRTWGRIGAWLLEIGSSGAIKLGEHFLAEEERPDAPRVAVISCGPLCQIWVKDVDRRLTLPEVETLCPGLVQALIEHPAVEVVVARDGEYVVVMGRRGRLWLRRLDIAAPATADREPIVRIEGEHPLAGYEEPRLVARQIAAFAGMEACGDLICFAASFVPETLRDATPGAAGERHLYSFEHQLGTHASAGGDQAYPFLLLPARWRFDTSRIVSAAQLHPVLRAIVERREGEIEQIAVRQGVPATPA
jgi:hypothetical protein